MIEKDRKEALLRVAADAVAKIGDGGDLEAYQEMWALATIVAGLEDHTDQVDVTLSLLEQSPTAASVWPVFLVDVIGKLQRELESIKEGEPYWDAELDSWMVAVRQQEVA